MGDAVSSDILVVTEPSFVFRVESYESGNLMGTLTAIENVLREFAGVAAELGLPEDRDDATEPADAVEPLTGLLLTRHRDRLVEMVFQRQVDQYLTYLSHLLALLFRTRPETLHARPSGRQDEPESVPLEVILQHATMEELLDAVVDRRVQTLAHKGMADLTEYLERRLGFQLCTEPGKREFAILIVEVRNIIAHNRGVVSDTFLRRVKASPWPIGERITFDDFATHQDVLTFLDYSVADIDERAIKKWALPTCRIEAPGEEAPRRTDDDANGEP